MQLKLRLKLKLSLALLAIFCGISRNATAQVPTADLTVGAELEAGEKAPFRGTLLRESTLQRVYADILKKDEFKKAVEDCQVETAYLAEKSESNEITWFLAGGLLGLMAGFFAARK